MPYVLAWLQAIDPNKLSPTLIAVNAVLGAVILVIIGLGLAGWTAAFTRLSSGQRVLPHEPRRNVPWGLIDLIALLALLLLTTILVQGVLVYSGLIALPHAGDPPVPPDRWMLAADAVTKFASLGLVIVFIRMRQPLTWQDLGFRGDRLLSDVMTGGMAFCMLAPVVFGIQFLLVQWWPSSHPLIEMLQESPSPWMFVMTCFSAVIVAPLSEELAFRVLLQGWLEKVAQADDEKWDPLLLGGFRQPEPLPAPAAGPPEEPMTLPAGDALNPYATPATELPAATPEIAASEHTEPPRLWFLPILISSLIFALLHYNHGPDWIPLSVLGLGLGYLYQRTHRATPSIVVHFLLNGLSMIGVGLQVFLLPDAK